MNIVGAMRGRNLFLRHIKIVAVSRRGRFKQSIANTQTSVTLRFPRELTEPPCTKGHKRNHACCG